MATKVTAGKLNVSVTESVTVNGIEQTYTNVKSIAGVQRTHHQIISIPVATGNATDNHTYTVLASTAAAASGGSFVPADIKYIRITNLDDTNFVVIRVQDTGADTHYFRLEAGETWIAHSPVFEVHQTAGQAANYSVLANTADNIAAIADGHDGAAASRGAVDVEIFIASKTDA